MKNIHSFIASIMLISLLSGVISADPIEIAQSFSDERHPYKELFDAHAVALQSTSIEEKEKAFLSQEELKELEKITRIEGAEEIKKEKSKIAKKNLLLYKFQELKSSALKRKEDKIRLVYEMFENIADHPSVTAVKIAKINTNSFIDGKFFIGEHHSTLNCIHRILFGPEFIKTVSGSAVAAGKLANPLSQASDIIANQHKIRFLLEDQEKFEQIDKVLGRIGIYEQSWLNLSFRKTRSEFLSGLAQPNSKSKPSRKQIAESKKYFDSKDWIWDPEKGKGLENLMDNLSRSSETGTFLFGNPQFILSGILPMITLLGVIGIPTILYKKVPKLKKGIFNAMRKAYTTTPEKEAEAFDAAKKGMKKQKEFIDGLMKNPIFKNFVGDLPSDFSADDLLATPNATEFSAMFQKMNEFATGMIDSMEGFIDGLFSRKRLTEIAKDHPNIAWTFGLCSVPVFAFAGFCGFIILKENLAALSKVKNTFSGILDAQKTLCEMRKLKDQMDLLCTMVDPVIFPEIEYLKKFVDCKTLDAELDRLLTQLDSKTFQSNPSLFSHHGKTIQAFIALEKLKERFAPAMKIVGEIDCMMAVVKNIKKTEGLANGFCLPEIVEGDQTVFEITGMWNLFVGPETSVPNNLFLGAGSPDGIYGAVISGPNFGGKSVYLLGTFTAAVLTQCFGFAPAKKMKLAPFNGFVTYVKVSDNPPIDSLFSAQCRKMRELFDLAWRSKEEGLKVLIIADELLTGTKVTYAESLVRSAIREFSSLGGCVYLFVTHFPGVTKNLNPDSRGRFKNMQVCANLDSEGFFDSPTFKVDDGESHVDAAFKVAESRFGAKYQHIIDNAKPLVLEQMSKKVKTRAMA